MRLTGRALLIVAMIIFYSGVMFFLTSHLLIKARSVESFRGASLAEQISPPIPTATTPAKQAVQAGAGLPVRLKIPALNIDALVEGAGLASDGTLVVPKGPADVTWFNLSPHPGERGSAVISGHYGWKNGVPAVFDDLSTLRKGDTIYVVDEKGATTTFVVSELRTYSDTQVVADVFSSDDGGVHLNLITCEGVWNAAEKSYSKRLVVFADKEAPYAHASTPWKYQDGTLAGNEGLEPPLSSRLSKVITLYK